MMATGQYEKLRRRVEELELEKVEGYELVRRLQDELAAAPGLQQRGELGQLQLELQRVQVEVAEARDSLEEVMEDSEGNRRWQERVRLGDEVKGLKKS